MRLMPSEKGFSAFCTQAACVGSTKRVDLNKKGWLLGATTSRKGGSDLLEDRVDSCSLSYVVGISGRFVRTYLNHNQSEEDDQHPCNSN